MSEVPGLQVEAVNKLIFLDPVSEVIYLSLSLYIYVAGVFGPSVLNQVGSPSLLPNACPFNSKALSIFDTKMGRLDFSSAEVVGFVQQIAKAANVPYDNIFMQLQDIYPRVKAMQTMNDLTNKEAWKKIYDKIHAVKGTSIAHPMDDLLEGLILLFVFGVSSSGVEQFFSKTLWGFSNRRGSASPATEEACLKAIVDLPNHDRDHIIQIAQKVWSLVYGEARASNTRCSRGVKREKLANSEATCIHKRREAAAVGSLSSSADFERLTSVSAFDVAQPGWSQQHTTELNFQRNKQHARQVQAVAEGTHGGTDALRSEVRQVKEKRVKAQRARERKDQRDTSALVGATTRQVLARIAGDSVYICEDLASPDVLAAAALYSLKRVRACEANVFVAQQPGQLSSQRVGLITALRGSFHITPSVLTSKGESGVAAKWRPIASIVRVIFVSQAVQDRNKRSLELFQEVLKTFKDNGITLVFGKDWGELASLKVQHSKSKSKLIAIVRTPELELPVLASVSDGRIVLKSKCLCLVH